MSNQLKPIPKPMLFACALVGMLGGAHTMIASAAIVAAVASGFGQRV